MSRSGPTPTPTELKRLRGTWRPDRDGDAPEPTVAIPSPPEFLDAIGLAEWHRVTPHLLKLGLVSELDRGALGLLCSAWSRVVLFAEGVAALESLFMAVGEKGYRQVQPEVSALRQAQDDYTKLSEHFGLSPSARSRISVQLPPEAAANKFAKHAKRGLEIA
jgi:P27 family predicted phage terminase small subunit